MNIFSGTILKGKEEVFAKSLHELAKEPVFNCMNFESLINDVRTHVAEVSELLYLKLVKKQYLS